MLGSIYWRNNDKLGRVELIVWLEQGNRDDQREQVDQGEVSFIIFGMSHPVLKRQDRLGKELFAGFGTVVEDIKRSGYTKNQPILLGAF